MGWHKQTKSQCWLCNVNDMSYSSYLSPASHSPVIRPDLSDTEHPKLSLIYAEIVAAPKLHL